MRKKFFLICLVLFGTLAFSASAETLRVNIYGASENILNLSLASPLNSGGQQVTGLGTQLNKAIQDDLAFLPFIRIIPASAILGGTLMQGYQPPNIDFKRFLLAQADLLVTAGWPKGDGSGSTTELRLYETSSGNFIFGKSYGNVTKNSVNDVADRFCADLMEALTGHGDFFRSTLAFVKTAGKHQRDVWIVKPTGRDLRQVTHLQGQALSPSWSKDGRFVVFSHLDDQSHALGVWDKASNRVQRIRFPDNTVVIGPTFLPSNKVAVSLSTSGYPDIYLLNQAFQKERAIESSPAINVSPSFDATGSKMAFTSSRMGGPQIFMKDMGSGSVTRVSKQGSYNTEPSMSPDGTLVAFSRLTSAGNRIFVQDLVTGAEQQVTFGPGNDEQPSFAPDSYFLAFTSNRGGSKQIYLITRHGGDAKKLPTGSGDASFARWSAVNK